MKKLLLLLLMPALLMAMELPVSREPLSPRSREMAQQRAVINANRIEQQAFQEEATNSIIDLESEAWILQQQVERLQEQSATIQPQMNVALLSLNAQARLSHLHGEQIGTLERTQQLQAQLQAQREANLQQRIAAAEKSNYYLKWALGISTAVTTTVFSVMGYLLWKNQQRIAEESKIIVDRNHKGDIVRFGQNRTDALQIPIPQPISAQKQPQSTPAVQWAAVAPQTAQPVPVQTPPAPAQPLPQYATQEQLQAVNARIDAVSARIPQIAKVMDTNGNIFLEHTDPGKEPRSGSSSYFPGSWPGKGFTQNLK